MLFLVGLERCDPEVLRDLLAQLRVVGPTALLRDHAERITRGAGGWLAAHARRAAGWLRGWKGGGKATWARVAGESADVLERMGVTLDEHARQEVSWLERELVAERRRLERLGAEALRWKMLETLAELAGVDDRYEPKAVARGVLQTCARHYGIETGGLPPEEIERRVAAACLDELQRRIVSALDSGELDEERLEELLDQELERLAEGDAEKVRQALDVDRLSGKALLGAVRKGTITLGTLAALGAGGFGPFMALSSFIKGVTLLLGVSTSFGVYTAAASLLGFLLSPVGMVLVAGAVVTPGAIDRARRIRAAQLAGVIAQFHAVLHRDAVRSDAPPSTGGEGNAPTDDFPGPMETKADRCPRCGSGDIAFILYGMPRMTPHLQEAIEQGRVVLGGCVVGLHHWYCNDCGHTFGED